MREYLEYCESDKQRRMCVAVEEHGSIRKAAAALGVNNRNAFAMVARIKELAARRLYAPEHGLINPTPPTHVGNYTLQINRRTGQEERVWLKGKLANDPAELIRAALDGLKDDIPKHKPGKLPGHTNTSLHNLYPITDYHLGMLAWGEECGEDWDTNIAEDLLYRWFEAAIKQAPNAASCTFAQMGDFLHWDGLEAVTPQSKHVLDADTRFQRVVRVAIRVMRRIIDLLLSKHSTVHIVVCDANHDPASGVWLREMLAAFYENEKRVVVDTNPDTYYAFKFGKTLLMFHHGHKRQVKDLDSVLVAKFAPLYGATEYRYAHTGHLHHDRVYESNLMHIEQHETLAPKDAFASRAGYMSKRSAKCIVYSYDYGEVSRVTIRPEMLK